MLTARDLSLPADWDLLVGMDSGTFMSAAFVAISPDPYEAILVEEFPNYRYVGDGEIELLGLSISEWAEEVTSAYHRYRPGDRCKPWIDANTQFGSELQHHGIIVQRNTRQLELRTEISREYFQHQKVWLAPWLVVLPYELESAQWPDDVNALGHYRRLKERDHTLDCVEHCLSRRPRRKLIREEKRLSFAEKWFQQHHLPRGQVKDVHLGPY